MCDRSLYNLHFDVKDGSFVAQLQSLEKLTWKRVHADWEPWKLWSEKHIFTLWKHILECGCCICFFNPQVYSLAYIPCWSQINIPLHKVLALLKKREQQPDSKYLKETILYKNKIKTKINMKKYAWFSPLYQLPRYDIFLIGFPSEDLAKTSLLGGAFLYWIAMSYIIVRDLSINTACTPCTWYNESIAIHDGSLAVCCNKWIIQ